MKVFGWVLGTICCVACLVISFFSKGSANNTYIEILIGRTAFFLLAAGILWAMIDTSLIRRKTKRLQVEYSLIENKEWDEVFAAISSMDEINIEAKLFLKENYTITKK